MASSLTITKDSVSEVIGAINELVGKQVLVGYPDDGAEREGPVNNATIAYAMEYGLPAQNVPARPTLIPGVNDALSRATESLQQAAESALNGDASKSDQFLDEAGIVAQNAVMLKINSNVPPPLKPSTIRARKYARGTQSRRASEDKYASLIKQGYTPGAAQSAAGIRTLINTGQMRGAVRYVVRKKGR